MPRQVQLLSTKEFLAAPTPPMLVESLVINKGLTAISADPGVGKTFFALQLGLSVAQGKPLFNRFRAQKGAVLFIGQDCSPSQYAQQARKILAPDGKQIADANNFHWLFHAGLDVKQPQDAAKIVQVANSIPNPTFDPEEPIDYEQGWVEFEGVWYPEFTPIYGHANGVALIVADTHRKLHRGQENSNDDMSVVFDHWRLIAEQTRASVVLLHHNTWAGEGRAARFRGATAQIGDLDAHFSLVSLKKQKDLKKLQVEKFRGIPCEDFHYYMHTDEKTCTFEFKEFVNPEPPTSESATTVRDDIRTYIINGLIDDAFETGDIVTFLMETRGMPRDQGQARASKALSQILDERIISRTGRGEWLRVVAA